VLLAAVVLFAGCGSSSNTEDAASNESVDTTEVVDTTVVLAPEDADSTTTTVDGVGTSGNSGQTPKPTTNPTPTAAPYVPRPLTPGLAGKIIVIDAGHNGGNYSHSNEINQLVDAGNGVTKQCDTTGTGSFDGYPEYAFTLSVAQQLQATLQAAGAQVVMVRSDSSGWGPCITERARIGNDARADLAIITDENPRGEDPAAIRAAIRAAAPDAMEIGDRRAAIAEAVAMLRAGDVLVVAGKGHETGQTMAGITTAFDDAAVLRGLLA
jgi:hypothetical protein